MTITRRLVVDLADVQALRIVCQTCRAVLSLSLTETIRVPTSCPNCHADWEADQWSARTRPVEQIVAALKAPPTGTAFVVQLELPAE